MQTHRVIGRALAGLLWCSALGAQEQPQLVWEGIVDGTSILQVRGSRVQVDDREGLPVQRQRFRFFERLPDSRQNVRMEVREGRGRVRIVQQPSLENNYVLAVSMEDRQGGSSLYSLEFFWDTGRGSFFSRPLDERASSSDSGEQLTWSGRVDGEAVVECRGRLCRAEAVSGEPVTRERVSGSGLPRREAGVSLDGVDGRGEVTLIEQPRRENGYTARVRIRDTKGGASDYRFTLGWARVGRGAGNEAIARRGMVWRGRVDGRVRVSVRGGEARSEVVRGGPVEREHAEFLRDLPRRENGGASVRRADGRGRVEMVEFPNRLNGYRLVFEIDDSSGGADDYEVEVSW